MFLARRPSHRALGEFLDQSRDLPLAYDPVGIARQSPPGFNADLASAVIGHGRETFERACGGQVGRGGRSSGQLSESSVTV